MFPPIFPLLRADDAVDSYVDDRIFPHGEADKGTPVPYVTWFVAGGVPENQLDAVPLMDSYVVNVRVWHDNPADVFAIAEAVRDALEPHSSMEEVPMSGKDDETRRYYVAMPFRFWVDRSPPASSI